VVDWKVDEIGSKGIFITYLLRGNSKLLLPLLLLLLPSALSTSTPKTRFLSRSVDHCHPASSCKTEISKCLFLDEI